MQNWKACLKTLSKIEKETLFWQSFSPAPTPHQNHTNNNHNKTLNTFEIDFLVQTLLYVLNRKESKIEYCH